MHGASTFVLLPVYVLAVLALIVAERQRSRAGMWATKPLASAIFLAMALSDGFPGTGAGRLLVLALALSFLGDFCLIPTDARIFRAGILLFLLAHVAFVGAFLALGVAWIWAVVALVPLAGAAYLISRWILRGVSAELKNAVIAYMVVITVMVALAAGTAAAGATPLLLVAALAFWSNDILVARDRFVKKTWVNRAVGLPLYYGAMALFALVASAS